MPSLPGLALEITVRTSHILIGILPAFLVIALLLSRSGFNGEMVFDSFAMIAESQGAFQSGSPAEVVRIYPARPVSMMTFYFNYLLTGMDTYGFRVVNALLQGLAAFSLLVLIRLIIGIRRVTSTSSADEKTVLALLAALAYLLHPVQSFVTLYVIQRMTILACLFSFTSLGFYVAARSGAIRSGWMGYGACFIFLVCGLLSKETAVIVPALIVLAEVILFQNIPEFSVRNIVLAALFVVALFAGLNAIQEIPGLGTTGLPSTIAKNFGIAGLSPWEAALSQCRVLFHYLWLMVAPFWAHAPLIKPLEVSRSLLTPSSTLPAVVGVAALVFACLFFVRRRPLTSFGIASFLVALIPEAVAVPQNLYFPQRVALPMAGMLLVMVDQLLAVMAWARERGRFPAIAASIALISLIWFGLAVAATVTRAGMWRDPVLVWKDSVDAFSEKQRDLEKFPCVTALNGMGEALRRTGNPAEAIAFHQRAAKVEPRNLQTWKDLAAAYWLVNRIDDARRAFEEAAKLDRRDAAIRSSLGAVLLKQKRLDESVQRYREAVELRPSDASFRRALYFALLTQGNRREAAEQLETAIRLQHPGPQLAVDHATLGKLLMEMGRPDENIAHLKTAVAMAPRMWQIQNNLGTALLNAGRPQEALAHFQKALAINPTSPEIRWNLDRAKSNWNPK